MPSFLAGILLTIAVLAVIVQLSLPAYVSGRVEDRLEKGGGRAEVSLAAFPAVSLLAGRGGAFEATGNGLSFDLGERREDPFDRLDGFADVDVSLSEVDAGPLRIRRFRLTRDGRGEDYDLAVDASITPRELVAELGSAAGGPLGGLVGSLAGGAIPGGGRALIPLELEAVLASEDGKADVTDARGSVAGLPAGPLARIVLVAVLGRL